MLLALRVPRFGELMSEGFVERCLVVPGTPIASGTRLLEMRVNLASVIALSCSPEFAFRVVTHEPGWLRLWSAAPGDIVAVGATVALVTTTPDEPIDGAEVRRALRVNCGLVPCE